MSKRGKRFQSFTPAVSKDASKAFRAKIKEYRLEKEIGSLAALIISTCRLSDLFRDTTRNVVDAKVRHGNSYQLSVYRSQTYFTIGSLVLLLKGEQQEPYDGRLSRTVL